MSEKIQWPEKMHPISGVRLGVASAGIKKAGRIDLLVFELNKEAVVSGVFTKNAFCAAPVTIARDHLSKESIRYLVVNSGNANACTGERGFEDALSVCSAIAEQRSVARGQVLPFSTGVIGEFLPVEKIKAALPQAFASLSEDAWDKAGRAIMTTDTCPKGASIRFDYNGSTICISGIAKGAGMIRPNMATMLSYVATDANISRDVLDLLLSMAVNRSFNRITIDGDTSTNDSCILIATGKSSAPVLDQCEGDLFELFLEKLTEVMQSLAHAIVKDGEGATKFVAIEVSGGMSSEECLQVAYAIAHSPLVKTALYASDANWGRIVAAIGYAGIPNLDISLINVYLDDVFVVETGSRHARYTDDAGTDVVKKAEFSIRVSLGRGAAKEVVWTSDLSHEYVTINAEYRS